MHSAFRFGSALIRLRFEIANWVGSDRCNQFLIALVIRVNSLRFRKFVIGSDRIGLDRIGLDWIGSDRIGLDRCNQFLIAPIIRVNSLWFRKFLIGSDWIGSDWIGAINF